MCTLMYVLIWALIHKLYHRNEAKREAISTKARLKHFCHLYDKVTLAIFWKECHEFPHRSLIYTKLEKFPELSSKLNSLRIPSTGEYFSLDFP